VQVMEDCIDGLAGPADLDAAMGRAEVVEAFTTGKAWVVSAAWHTAEHACSAAQATGDPAAERRHQADLLWEVVGNNPFRKVGIGQPRWPGWRGGGPLSNSPAPFTRSAGLTALLS